MIDTAVAIPMMTETEARACVERIRTGMENVRSDILDLYEREGWQALGYDSWRHCIAVEFSVSVSRAYQLLDAARVDRMLSTVVETGPIPEAQTRELARLKDEPEAVREVWAEITSDGPATADKARRAVDRRQGITREDPEPDEPELSSVPPSNLKEAWILIADQAAFIRDQVMTKIVMVDGQPTRHDRHCAFTAEHQACARKCQQARSLIERSELLG